MAEFELENPAPQNAGANEQDIQLIIKKLAYIAIQFKKILEEMKFSRPRSKWESDFKLEMRSLYDLIIPEIWYIRKLVKEVYEPEVDDDKREGIKHKIKGMIELLEDNFNQLLECNRDLILRFEADDKRKEKYLKLIEEFNKVKEMIEKTVLS
ncbi:MAG: hypothetical protein QXL51_03990 [Candidatus Aenigmatarchaeota archaeon]